jgi:DNA (cytosine-5)-methyltransferase 1
MRSVELFSGCGGLAMGLSQAGFKHTLMVEWNENAHATLVHNKARNLAHIGHWPFVRADVRTIDWTCIGYPIDLVAGGPPCQPFSIGGKHAGPDDTRDMWPEAIRAVRELAPKAFLFENVRGLLRPAFAEYLKWIKAHLAAPHIERRPNESYAGHIARLDLVADEALYEVMVLPVNAADYGAAQKRNRVIIAGIRKELGVSLALPAPTHTKDRLLWDQWVTGAYWRRHGARAPSAAPGSAAEHALIGRLRRQGDPPAGLPWVTCRDALAGLPEPKQRVAISNHVFQAGARVYVGHTGSPIDEPAKALKAGDHGVPGGENMIVKPNGDVRYFTVREASRLQGLPEDYEFPRSWTESMRQLGNAVPVPLAKSMGLAMQGLLTMATDRRREAA